MTEIENLSKWTFQGGTFVEWFPQWKEFPDDWWGRIAFLCAPDSIRTVLAIVLICAWFHFCNVEPVKCEEEEDMRYLANMERRVVGACPTHLHISTGGQQRPAGATKEPLDFVAEQEARESLPSLARRVLTPSTSPQYQHPGRG